SVTAADTAVYY
nr:immunoglobulin heavy chain junction region [Homo sapiens]